MKEYLLAYDIGTSGTKASLFSTDGHLLQSATEGYTVYFDKGGVCEQDPEDWWQAVVRATQRITQGIAPTAVRALSFSGQMMGCLPVDTQGRPLRRSIIWSDTRAKAQEKELIERIGRERGYRLLGHRISCSYSLAKLMWIKQHEPDIYARTYRILQAKDYIIHKMTGAFVCDYSDASGTNMLDLHRLTWSEEILQAAELDLDKLPELHASTDVAGQLHAAAAAQLGLWEGMPVVCGGGDGPCSTLGAGCIKDGQYFLTFGTSAWIAGTTKEVFLDEEKLLFSFAHVIPGRYMPTGTMQAAGASYAYLKRTFCEAEAEQARQQGTEVYELLNQLIASSPVGAKGLLYLPYLTGERSPRWNPHATGAFLGMTMEHTRADYLRAGIEGVAMNLAVILEAQRKNAGIQELILTGGGAKGEVVTHILADVLGCRMIRPNHVEEATSMAAAVLAGMGAGIYDSFDVIQSYLRFGEAVEPDWANHAHYRRRLKVFNAAYQALEPIYPMINEV